MPLFLKSHSYGEYVFDWAWADAYARHGLEYYPKLLGAIPFTPVRGARLLARDAEARRALIGAALDFARELGVSSLHVLFPTDAERDALAGAGMLIRSGVQFHWRNRGYADFEQFLGELEQKKRKNIRAERRKVAQAGVRFRHLHGAQITEADWHFFARCYANTYREHHSTPYLNRAFFLRLGATMPENLHLVIADREQDGGVRPIASSLLVVDEGPESKTAYGRYWGALETVPCLHFETAFYQPLQWCIEAGVAVFEGGAQGEHKMARGLMPVATHSAHWLAHPAFADAVENFLQRETQGIDAYLDELGERSPFRAPASGKDAE